MLPFEIAPQQIIAAVAVAFGVLTVVMGVSACLHVLGFVTLRAPYATWVVVTFFFSVLGAFAAAVKVFVNPAPAVAQLQCGNKDVAAISNHASLTDAWRVPECQALLDGWLASIGRYSASSVGVIDALVSVVPARLGDETPLAWRTRIRDTVDEHPTLGPLRKRAREQDAPFQSTSVQMRIARGSDGPAPGEVHVKGKNLDGQLLLVSSEAHPKCLLRLRARDVLPTATSEIPLLQFNAAQRQFLLGNSAINDSSGSKLGLFAIASANQIADDPSEERGCARN